LSRTAVEAQCTASGVQSCMGSVANTSQSIIKMIQADFFDNDCRALPTVNRCIADLGCTETDEAAIRYWHGTRDSLTYVCNDPEARAVISDDLCLNSNRVVSRVVVCRNQFINSLFAGVSECTATDTYLTCVENSISECGQTKTKIFMTFAYKLFKPATTLIPGCNLKEPKSIRSSAIKSSASVLLLVLGCLLPLTM